MRVYRIDKATYSDQFPPTGSLYANGRWHNRGMWVVYTSENIALAKLEVLANSISFPKNRVLRTIEISKDAPIKDLNGSNLPKNWMNIPYPTELTEIIKDLIKSGKFVGVKVPSTQSPGEKNILLFPGNKRFGECVKEIGIDKAGFDVRFSLRL